ncbi:brain protein I3 isoform X2 [Neovison vison]|uniref:brain protein I3 isoform X2 n=1 Tax=Neovison vison TaxID=452646 RepID=UPI001CEFFE62|nr:brain protein I3 isoform X2 [Neogale vison]XP_044089731.1 brain protein I3 isoform X2 [Neogale vison]XP_044089733.1 brain protein I3 isoform X2 [Neogale vison]
MLLFSAGVCASTDPGRRPDWDPGSLGTRSLRPLCPGAVTTRRRPGDSTLLDSSPGRPGPLPFPVERPPAYNLEAGQGDFACGPHGYGAIPAAPPPPPYPYLVTGIPTHHPRVYNIHSRNVTRYPANSIVVVGGCPVCRVGVLEDSFTFLGIFLAIILFPFGFICCFALRKRRCPNCGANFT